MKKSQARGYLLEIVLAKLLEVNGYQIIKQTNGRELVNKGNGLNIKGRGGYHQFDVLGQFKITPPFIYPTRLFLEAKYYSQSNRIGIQNVRMATGILDDVNQSHVTVDLRGNQIDIEKKNVFNYRYAIFSTSGFTTNAQTLALAHQIHLIDLSSGYNAILNFVDCLINLIFGNNEVIASHIFEFYKKCLQFKLGLVDSITHECYMYECAHFCDYVENLGSLYIASTESSQIIPLLPDNDSLFRQSLINNPHQQVRITWDEQNPNTWIVTSAEREYDYRLTFKLPPVIEQYVFGQPEDSERRALDAKRNLGKLAFIAYLDGQNPTLCTLTYDEEETRRLVERNNRI